MTAPRGTGHIRGAQLRRTRRRLVDRDAGPRDDHEMREVQEARIPVPRGNSCKRIAAENEEKLRRPPAEMRAAPQRVLRVRAALAYELHVRDVAFGAVLDGQNGKREPLIDARARLEERSGWSCAGTNTISSSAIAALAASAASR